MDCCSSVPGDKPGQDACVVPSGESGEKACPECGRKGRQVDIITLKSLLIPAALRRLVQGEYRFCPTAECDVVYFGTSLVFRTQDVNVPIWQKSGNPSDLVCYCFEYSEDSIREEIAATGISRATDEITRLVKEGRCACEVRNPQGTCCLGNVSQVVTKAQNSPGGRAR